ncbi:MAG: response regulator transcription factor [Chloroflexi bacterium]|nr:response regulator transcription factor [Chloroflexota bacterium]
MSVVLLLTRNASVRELVRSALTPRQHEVVEAESTAAVVRALLAVEVDAVVVDSGLGGEEMREAVQWLRANGLTPVVFLATAEERWLPGAVPARTEVDEVLALPCSPGAVVEALEKVLAASGQRASGGLIALGGARLDCSSRELAGAGKPVSLTPTEFRLLEYLAHRRGAIISSDELLERVWEFPAGTGSSELVRSHMRNLRTKIRTATQGEELIRTVPRRGYCLS